MPQPLIMRQFLFFLWFMPAIILAQPVMPVTSEDFPDARAGIMDTYDATTVMEYNDEAALFIELGFKTLIVQEIAWDNAKIKAEVYQMETPEAAFGAYSVSVLKCAQRDTLISYDCNDMYQYQASYGSFYIIISSESGSKEARDRYLPVANALMQHNPQQRFELPEPFNQPLLKKSRKNLVYAQGTLGLQNIQIPWQELFLLVRFRMYAITLANNESDFYFGRISFETPDDMARFLHLAGLMEGGVPIPNTNTNNGLYREYRQVDNLTIYFLQSQEPWPISAVINQ